MRAWQSLFLFVVLTGLCGTLRATTPALSNAFSGRALSPSAASITIDLRGHFHLPGVTGQVVQFATDFGNFNVELHANAAPVTVTNFLSYVSNGSYTNSFVHRLAYDYSAQQVFAIQGGGFKANTTLTEIPMANPISLESSLPNVRGTLAMARMDDPNSATSQWFINTRDNTSMLPAGTAGGYAVFGRVLGSGMSVVDVIAAMPAYNLFPGFLSAFMEVPLRNYIPGQPPMVENLVKVIRTDLVPIYPATGGGASVLAFTAQSSAPEVVAAAISGSDLVLTPAATTGTASITITATDTNGNTATGSFTVTVEKPAQTLSFAALPDRPFTTSAIPLEATASSGLPVTFTVIDGPATINGNALTLTGAGSVTVRATQAGNDSFAAVTAERTFTVTPNFAWWQIESFTADERQDPAISGPDAVAAGDGLSNLLKYALGLEPRLPAETGLPQVARVGDAWVFTYGRPPDRVDVTYVVEASADLKNWSSAGVTHQLVAVVDDIEQWRATAPAATFGPTVFFRLKVTLP